MDKKTAQDLVTNAAADCLYVSGEQCVESFVIDKTTALELSFTLRERLSGALPEDLLRDLAHEGETLGSISERVLSVASSHGNI